MKADAELKKDVLAELEWDPAIHANAVAAKRASSAVGTRADLRATLDLAATGKLRCHCHTRPLAEANQALDELRAGRVQGRTVLIPHSSPA